MYIVYMYVYLLLQIKYESAVKINYKIKCYVCIIIHKLQVVKRDYRVCVCVCVCVL